MEYDIGKVQWNTFLRKWGDAFENARLMVSQLGKEVESLSSLGLGEIIDPGRMDELQRDWIRLCGVLMDPLERDAFKPWWIPVEKNSYDVFIDLSNDRLPVFRLQFFFLKPHRWYKEPVTDDISSLLLALESGTDLDELHRTNELAARKLVDGFFEERKALAFRGNLEIRPPARNELRKGDEGKFVADQNYNVDFHTVRGIGPLAIGLLPFDLPVDLKEFSVKYGSQPSQAEKIKCIRDLVYLLRHTGAGRINSYYVETRGERAGSFAFLDNELSIANPDQELVKSFFSQLSAQS